ncbi:hypothetical protein JXA12_02140 [Candidatus Woesearchaeota archaeon]|nr:hypothetical protein [Candidatus Woesearchaeota archaeon]
MDAHEFYRIRDACMQEGITLREHYDRERSRPPAQEEPAPAATQKKRRPQPAVHGKTKQPAKTPDAIMHNIVESLRERKAEADLETITARFERELRERKVESPAGPLMGYVSNALYREAQRAKDRSLQGEKYKQPVTEDELAERLEIRLDDTSVAHVMGRLSPAYVREHYPLTRGKLQDEHGRPYSIEGSRSWDGKHKAETRERLVSFIEGSLLKGYLERKEELERELDMAKESLASEKRGNGKELVGYVLRQDEKGAFMKFKNQRNSNSLYQRLLSVDCARVRTGACDIRITWENEKARAAVERIIKDIREAQKRGTPQYLGAAFRVEKKEERLESGCEQSDLEVKVAELKRSLGELTGTPLRYLGLEGPCFGSFLEVKEAVEGYGFKLVAVLPEYLPREANLMRSVIAAYPEAFAGVEVIDRNVNDAILLDFIKDPAVGVGYVKGRRGEWVTCHGEAVMPLRQYQEMVELLGGGASPEVYAREHGVDEDFVERAMERYEGQFDVVFLDYFCGESYRRSKGVRQLVRRLGDGAVVAITTNLAGRVNFGKDTSDVLYQQLERFLADERIVVEDFVGMPKYSDGKEPMGFVAYHVKRRS